MQAPLPSPLFPLIPFLLLLITMINLVFDLPPSTMKRGKTLHRKRGVRHPPLFSGALGWLTPNRLVAGGERKLDMCSAIWANTSNNCCHNSYSQSLLIKVAAELLVRAIWFAVSYMDLTLGEYPFTSIVYFLYCFYTPSRARHISCYLKMLRAK